MLPSASGERRAGAKVEESVVKGKGNKTERDDADEEVDIILDRLGQSLMH